MKPVRIQRKRTKGWNMQDASRAINGLEAVYVGRPTVFGNPFAGPADIVTFSYRQWLRTPGQVHLWPSERIITNQGGISIYHKRLILSRLPELRGKNLCCWCSLSDECHADILLELANKGEPK